MEDFKPRPGTFLPLLEYSQRDRQFALPKPVSPITILEILSSQAKQSLPLFELLQRSGLEPYRFLTALRSLRDGFYITEAGEVLDQFVLLTASGANLANLARIS